MNELLATEQHYSVAQVAEMWSVSEDTVRRLFQDQPGVLRVSMPRLQKNRKQRPHVLLRIPASVLARLHQQWAAGLRLEVQPRRRRIE
jgi:DeoR-like helix-turn-helix domain